MDKLQRFDKKVSQKLGSVNDLPPSLPQLKRTTVTNHTLKIFYHAKHQTFFKGGKPKVSGIPQGYNGLLVHTTLLP